MTPSPASSGPDRLATLRFWLGVAGVLAAAAAVAFDTRVGAWAAVGLLSASLALRLVRARQVRKARGMPDDLDE